MLALTAFAAAIPAVVSATTPMDVAQYVAEAAQRTGIPEPVIWAVIDVESRGQVRALSPKGAMGLMQLMPGTWAGLRTQLHLGNDPFDAHDNIIAGAVYLRYLYDRYGWAGVFAAYNAGPGRYESYRDEHLALPAETISYVTRVTDKLAGQTFTISPVEQPQRQALWTEASLFADDVPGPSNAETTASTPISPFIDLTYPSRLSPQ